MKKGRLITNRHRRINRLSDLKTKDGDSVETEADHKLLREKVETVLREKMIRWQRRPVKAQVLILTYGLFGIPFSYTAFELCRVIKLTQHSICGIRSLCLAQLRNCSELREIAISAGFGLDDSIEV